jgi:hypothetical protein
LDATASSPAPDVTAEAELPLGQTFSTGKFFARSYHRVDAENDGAGWWLHDGAVRIGARLECPPGSTHLFARVEGGPGSGGSLAPGTVADKLGHWFRFDFTFDLDQNTGRIDMRDLDGSPGAVIANFSIVNNFNAQSLRVETIRSGKIDLVPEPSAARRRLPSR